ncbi:uncharacterized protein TNCV_3438081 [Trichonephila clavipes]|nr:uncharacterized protein TNCV_3438081 [Trichonephila clavipes]
MNPHRPKNPASDEYTSDEEEMIVYDVEDEIESNPDYVKENGIGGEPKSVKRLRFGDMLIETTPALQTKSFLLAKSFLNSPVTVNPHKSLNSCRGVISEPDLKVSLIRVSLRSGELQ